MKSKETLTTIADKALEASGTLTSLMSEMVEIVDRQAKLLASKDIGTYQQIIAADRPVGTPEVPETDDQIAFREILNEGREMTNDEKIYFANAGFEIPES